MASKRRKLKKKQPREQQVTAAQVRKLWDRATALDILAWKRIWQVPPKVHTLPALNDKLERKDDVSEEPLPPVVDQRYFMVTPGSGSVFAAIARHLLQAGWVKLPNATASLHLFLGDKVQVETLFEDHCRLRAERFSQRGDYVVGLRGCQSVKRRRSSEGTLGPLLAVEGLQVNYFSGSKHLTLKTRMVATLREAHPAPFGIAPPSFIIYPKSLRAHSTDERHLFRQGWLLNRQQPSVVSPSNVWVAKSTHGSKGASIFLSSDCDAMLDYIDKDGREVAWVVQQYIERPLLLDGRKFDIRVWVLVTHPFDIWYYRRGVCRTASCSYKGCNGGTLQNAFMHLTNNAIQKDSPDYGKHELENFVWFEAIEEKFK
eukprot:Sspe_Gene.90201::Locus_61805_Transcript_1_1_Confidence_1.000_Length_1217::g.90201::m.90201/K06047/TTL; tubulin---tyrosine ligase